MRADRGDHVTTCRKAEYSDFVRVYMPARCLGAHKSHCPLRVQQCSPTITIRPHSEARNAVLQHDARDAFGRQPVAGFCAFKIDRENEITTTGEYDDRGAGVARLW